jgi:flagellar FliJ protein
MDQPTALESLIEFARAQRDDALARFANSMSQARAVEDRLMLLTNYRNEYAASFAEIARSGLTADRLRNFRLFLDKLDLAIEQQGQAADSQSEQVAEQRTAWAGSETRLQGYAMLQDRRLAVVRQKLRRDEQKGTDEHASRSVAMRAAAGNNGD